MRHLRFLRLLFVAVVLAGCSTAPRRVAHPEWPSEPGVTPIMAVQPESPEKEGAKPNFVGLFLGATHKGSETGFSFGLKYARRLTKLLGIGVVLEHTNSLRERLVTLPALFVYPYEDLSLTFAPGIEREDGETSFLFRVGAGWDFDIGGGFSIAPEVSVDFVEGTSDIPVIFGVTVGYKF